MSQASSNGTAEDIFLRTTDFNLVSISTLSEKGRTDLANIE